MARASQREHVTLQSTRISRSNYSAWTIGNALIAQLHCSATYPFKCLHLHCLHFHPHTHQISTPHILQMSTPPLSTLPPAYPSNIYASYPSNVYTSSVSATLTYSPLFALHTHHMHSYLGTRSLACARPLVARTHSWPTTRQHGQKV